MKNDLYLLHYGVKGMKWGVRKSLDKSGRKSYRKDAKAKKTKLTFFEIQNFPDNYLITCGQ